MKSLLFLLIFFSVCSTLTAKTTLQDTVGLQIRDGLPNFFQKASTGQTVHIGYFGGSITNEGDGWRFKSLGWFRTYFDNQNIGSFNASIGGTNSKYGVFRIDEDLLSKQNFDLVFIEFAVNDLSYNSNEIEKCIEGIVRKIWKKNPYTDICFVHMFRDGAMLDSLNAGKLPITSVRQDHVAAHYGIPSIVLGPKVISLVNRGTAVFKGTVTHSGDMDADGKYVITEDGVHPTNYGHQLYSDIITGYFKPMSGIKSVFAHSIEPVLDAGNYENAKRYPYSSGNYSGFTEVNKTGMYTYLDKFITPQNHFLLSEDQSSYFEFTYVGSILGLSIISGPNTGNGIVKIDDKIYVKDFFDNYSYYYREGSFFINAPADTHTVRIYPDVPLSLAEKEAILISSERSDIQNNPSNYLHNYIIFNKILVNGTILSLTTGDNPERLSEDLKCYYHDGYLTISVSNEYIGDNLSIYTMNGQLVYQDVINGIVTIIPIANDKNMAIVQLRNHKSGDETVCKVLLK